MAKIKRYAAHKPVVPYSTAVRMDITDPLSLYEAASGMGRAIQRVGTVSHLLSKQKEEDAEKIQASLKQLDENDWVSRNTTQFSTEVADFALKESANPEGYTKRLQNFMRSRTANLAAAPPSVKSASRLKNRLDQYFAQHTTRALSLEHNFKMQRYSQNLDFKLGDLEKTALIQPGQVHEVFAEGMAFISDAAHPKKGGIGWMTEDDGKRAAMIWKNRVYGTALEGFIEKDPVGARQELEAGQWNDFLSADQILKFKKITKAKEGREDKFGKAKVKMFMRDDLASRATSGKGNEIVLNLVREVLGDNYAEEHLKAQKFAEQKFHFTEVLTESGPEDAARLLSEIKPPAGSENYRERYQFFTAMTAQYQNIQKALIHDPALYVSQFTEADSPENSVALQISLGLQDHQTRVLTLGQAKEAVSEINRLAPEQRANVVEALSGNYGQWWPKVYSELVNAGLPEETQILVHLDGPEDVVTRISVANAVKAGEKQLKDLIADPVVVRDTVEKVRMELSEFQESVLRGGVSAVRIGQLRNILKAVELTALYYAGQGQDPGDAAKKAANEIINSKYEFTDTYRVPRDYDVDSVEDYADRVLDQLEGKDILIYGSTRDVPEKRRREETIRSVKSDGFWTVNENEDGLVLMHNGIPVKYVNGQRIEIWFGDAVHEGPIFRGRIQR